MRAALASLAADLAGQNERIEGAADLFCGDHAQAPAEGLRALVAKQQQVVNCEGFLGLESSHSSSDDAPVKEGREERPNGVRLWWHC